MLKDLLLNLMGFARIKFMDTYIYYPKSVSEKIERNLERLEQVGGENWYYKVIGAEKPSENKYFLVLQNEGFSKEQHEKFSEMF